MFASLNILKFRGVQYTREFDNSTDYDKQYLFFYRFKTICPWNDLLISFPYLIDNVYHFIIHRLVIEYHKTDQPKKIFTLNNFKEVLQRLEKLKFKSYKKGNCESREIELHDISESDRLMMCI